MAVILPEKFMHGHKLAFTLHDMLADHIVAGEEARLQFFEVKLKNEDEAAAMENLGQDEFWEWCEQNGYRHILDEFCYRQLLFGLLSDMCHFLYEGLKCSEKGKVAVALSNLRKPLQDNLFLLEWMLADRVGFLAQFRQGPEQIALAKMRGEEKKAFRVDIITRAMEQTSIGRWIDVEHLYELRYEKASDLGFDPLFNKALHLVTTFKHYATEPENINFIFSDDEEHEYLWHHIYTLLPVVLIHGLYVVRALFQTIAPTFEPHPWPADFWLMAGYLLLADTLVEENEGTTEQGFASRTFNEMAEDLQLVCPNCRVKFNFDTDNIRSLWECGKIACRACAMEICLNPDEDSGEEVTSATAPPAP